MFETLAVMLDSDSEVENKAETLNTGKLEFIDYERESNTTITMK